MKALKIVLVAMILTVAVQGSYAKEFTDQDIAKIIANAPKPEMLPQAGAVVLVQQRTIKYNPDMSAVSDELLVIKILQDRGKTKYGDIKRRYNKDSDSMVVLKAVTHLPDSTIREVELKAINDVTPAGLADAAIYSNVRQKVISFPAMAPGVAIELRLRTYSKAPEPGEKVFVWGGDLFKDTEPVSYKELTLSAPSSVPITYTVQNENISHTETDSDGYVTHTWTKNNAPQVITEPNMPPFSKVAPRLIYTSAQSWNEVGAWIGEKYYPHVLTSGDIKKKAESLTKGISDTNGKIRKIALYVINDIRDVGESSLPLGLAGYEPHDADSVLHNKYGDWRDKSVLLVSLLKAVGIDGFPAFVNHDEAELAEANPSLRQFDAVYVCVPVEGADTLWINPFADHCYFGWFPYGQGSKALVVRQDGSEIAMIPETGTDRNLAVNSFEMFLKPNGDVEGSVACDLSGLFDNMTRGRLKDETPKKVEQFFQSAVNALGEGSLSVEHKTSDLSDLLLPVKIAQRFTTPELGILEGDMMVFHVPSVPFEFASAPVELGDATRLYDFELDSKVRVKTSGVIHLPAGFQAVFVPEPVTIENQYGSWSTRYSLAADGVEVEYEIDARFDDRDINPEEYPAFKQAFDSFSSPKNSLILLERKQ